MLTDEIIISTTKNWIKDVVIGCNFCPFAKKELQLGSIHFEVERAAGHQACLQAILRECARLDEEESIATTLLIYPDEYADFEDFLDILELAESLLTLEDYDGVYQLGSFHPNYIFAGAIDNDPANYTNRSLYPMFHLLRENSVSLAVDTYPNIEDVPEQNMLYARKKGLVYMQALREACFGKS